ncbi:MAG: ribosomal protein S18-alanine N-acetyltransferase [Pigmentiphaga sp.]
MIYPVPMLPDDLDDVIRIEREVYSHPWTLGNFRDALAAGYAAWILRQQDELLAYCLVMEVPDELHILNLSVAAAHQGKGLARELLQHIDHDAQRRRCGSLLLEVRVSNARARSLYENAGFRAIGLRRGYYPSVRGREDAIVMRKPVLPAQRVYA